MLCTVIRGDGALVVLYGTLCTVIRRVDDTRPKANSLCVGHQERRKRRF